ncbi:dihydrofolate reductase, partial [Tsukamurella tyrosinosolvens]
MRSLVYYVAVSLDGRIAGPEGQYDFYPVDEEYSRQMNEEWGDGLPTGLHEALGITPPLTKWDTVVMGTATYRIGADVGVNDPYSHLR